MKKYRRLVSPARSSSIDSDASLSPTILNRDGDLYKYNKQCCEFCDAVFYNKYGIMIHNARHIIIPLQNHTMYQCNVCLYHYTSQEELLFHSATKHGITSSQLDKKNITKTKKQSLAKKENTRSIDVDKQSQEAISKKESNHNITKDVETTTKSKTLTADILETIINSKPRITCDDTVNKLLEKKKESDLGSFVEKQPVVRCEDTVNELIKSINDSVTTESDRDIKKRLKKEKKRQKKRRRKLEKLKRNGLLGIHNGATLPDNFKAGWTEAYEKSKSIKNKIVFEDSDNDLEFIGNVVVAEAESTQASTVNLGLLQKNIDTPLNAGLSHRLQAKDIDSDVEILDLCSDNEAEKTIEEIILPDNNEYLVKRIIVPDDSYILPDSGPEFIIPDKLPETKPTVNGTLIPNNLKPFNGISAENEPYGLPIQNEPFFAKIILGSKVTQDNGVSSTVEFRPSVHYKDLLAPGLYGCRRCKLKFPDRYHLIFHEKCHIKIRLRIYATQANNCPVCDWYIVGNHYLLKRHIKEKHPQKPDRTYSLSLCKKCGLRYRNYAQHERNYHKIFECDRCGHKFDSHIDRLQHEQELKCVEKKTQHDVYVDHKKVQILKVCELCLKFMKESGTIKYIVCGEASKLGKRQKCEKCHKEFFTLKLVKRIHKWKSYDDTNGFNDSKKKGLSNNARLKNMQYRLKKFNKLSQC